MKHWKFICVFPALANSMMVAAEPPTGPFLTLNQAEKAASACRQLAEEKGWRIAIAITDSGGNLVAFARMDDARVKPIEVAMLKAETASTIGLSTLLCGALHSSTAIPRSA